MRREGRREGEKNKAEVTLLYGDAVGSCGSPSVGDMGMADSPKLGGSEGLLFPPAPLSTPGVGDSMPRMLEPLI